MKQKIMGCWRMFALILVVVAAGAIIEIASPGTLLQVGHRVGDEVAVVHVHAKTPNETASTPVPPPAPVAGPAPTQDPIDDPTNTTATRSLPAVATRVWPPISTQDSCFVSLGSNPETLARCCDTTKGATGDSACWVSDLAFDRCCACDDESAEYTYFEACEWYGWIWAVALILCACAGIAVWLGVCFLVCLDGDDDDRGATLVLGVVIAGLVWVLFRWTSCMIDFPPCETIVWDPPPVAEEDGSTSPLAEDGSYSGAPSLVEGSSALCGPGTVWDLKFSACVNVAEDDSDFFLGADTSACTIGGWIWLVILCLLFSCVGCAGASSQKDGPQTEEGGGAGAAMGLLIYLILWQSCLLWSDWFMLTIFLWICCCILPIAARLDSWADERSN